MGNPGREGRGYVMGGDRRDVVGGGLEVVFGIATPFLEAWNT